MSHFKPLRGLRAGIALTHSREALIWPEFSNHIDFLDDFTLSDVIAELPSRPEPSGDYEEPF